MTIKPSEKADVPAATQPYEPPRIESVMTADELAREIQYAGNQTPGDIIIT